MQTAKARKSAEAARWPWVALLALALFAYLFGLGGQYIPTNGDELVYAHIARLTALSNQWLPLVSDLPNMRNTKPPLLFWQAMAAGDWARDASHWTMFALRLPNLAYTFLTAALVAWSVKHITQDTRRALLAACLFLAFFSTFRYGRPYLTSAPETFWLALPMFALIFRKSKEKRAVSHINYAWTAPKYIVTLMGLIAVGLAWGLGSAYKSFALIAPAAAAWWSASLLASHRIHADFGVKPLAITSLRAGMSVLIGVGVFVLWFVLDPDPGAVWREFVVGENVGKMGDKLGWWHEAIYGGGSSLWAQALAYLENAGLLSFVVIGVVAVAFKNRKTLPELPPYALILLAWLLVWWLVFLLPSQRSARYVIPAMPALAIAVALGWHHIGRGWFLASCVLIGLAAIVLGRIAWVMYEMQIATSGEFFVFALVFLGIAALLAGGFARPGWTRVCTLAACLAVYAAFGLTVAPLDGNQGRYGAATQAAFVKKSIAVPSNFNAQWERFEFLLPGNHIVPFDMAAMGEGDKAPATLGALLRAHDAVVWGQASVTDLEPPCRPGCRVVATRWVVKERHKSGDITWGNLWHPQLWLFSREWLIIRGGI